jgi:alcohol dehydrogenase class IV
MKLSTFSFPTTIVFGAGSVALLPEELKKRNVRRPLLVTDAGIERTPMFERVRALVPEASVFSKVDPNPTEQNVLDGTAAYQAASCDGVIALGGGSPLDAAKAIRLMATPCSTAEIASRPTCRPISPSPLRRAPAAK